MNVVYIFGISFVLIGFSVCGMEEDDLLAATQSLWSGFYAADCDKALQAIVNLDEETVLAIQCNSDVKRELFEQAIDNCLVNKDEKTSKKAVEAIKALHKKGILFGKEEKEKLKFWEKNILNNYYSDLINFINTYKC